MNQQRAVQIGIMQNVCQQLAKGPLTVNETSKKNESQVNKHSEQKCLRKGL